MYCKSATDVNNNYSGRPIALNLPIHERFLSVVAKTRYV